MRKSPKTRGFTILELLLVVVIICIVTALIVLAIGSVQAKNRNSQRQTDIDSLRTQLESYYGGAGHYPAFEHINNPDWRSKNVPKLTGTALDDPQWQLQAECTQNARAALAAFPAPGCYSYQVIAADGSPCDNDKVICMRYLLTATLEGGGTYDKSNLD